MVNYASFSTKKATYTCIHLISNIIAPARFMRWSPYIFTTTYNLSYIHYFNRMQDPYILEMTASDPMTLDDVKSMQISFKNDENSKFISNIISSLFPHNL